MTNPLAQLTLVIHYDEYPGDDEVREVIEKAKEQGEVVKATLEMFAPQVRDATNI